MEKMDLKLSIRGRIWFKKQTNRQTEGSQFSRGESSVSKGLEREMQGMWLTPMSGPVQLGYRIQIGKNWQSGDHGCCRVWWSEVIW